VEPCWNVTIYIKNSPHSVSPSLTALLNGESWQPHLTAPCGKSHHLWKSTRPARPGKQSCFWRG